MTTSYEELVVEMERISTVIQKFPENLQGKVFDIMVKSYLGSMPLKRQLRKNRRQKMYSIFRLPTPIGFNPSKTSDSPEQGLL